MSVITTIDEKLGTVTVNDGGSARTFPLASTAGFAAASRAWLRASWDVKHVYGFSWLGRPIIQLPEDIIRIQELIYSLKPDVVIETGVAHGGSLIFYASLFKVMNKGRVIGIDVEIRPHNRKAIEAHELFPLITLIEGSSIAPSTFAQVQQLIVPGERVMVILDSNHSYKHVMTELELYAPLVSVNSYVVVCDGIMEMLPGAPRSQPDWGTNNPSRAARDFAKSRPEFVIEAPARVFDESNGAGSLTYWPDGYLKRIAPAPSTISAP